MSDVARPRVEAADRRRARRRRRGHHADHQPGHRGAGGPCARGVGRAGRSRGACRAGRVPEVGGDAGRGAGRIARARSPIACSKAAPELVPLIISETGATATVGSRMQVPVAIERFQRYARDAAKDLNIALPPSPVAPTPLAPGALMGAYVNRQPVGAVACISPYNFPLTNVAGKMAPALAVGCTVVMKPAPQDPLAILVLAEIMREVGFPPGVVNVVTSAAPAPAAALTESPRHRHGLVHRLDCGGAADLRRGRAHHEAPPARARRQGRGGRVRRRRPRPRGHHHQLGVDVPQRPDLHRADPRRRAPLPLPGARRPARGDGGRAARSATRCRSPRSSAP